MQHPPPRTQKPGRQRPGNIACVVINKFLTIINDLIEAYLIGIQLSIEQILMAELLLSFEHTMTLTCGCVEELVSLLR